MAIEFIEQPLPQVQQIPFSVNNWQGLNRIKGSESMGEMVNMKNMSSDNAPFSSPRKPREVITDELTNGANIFDDEKKMGYIDAGKFYYDGIEKGECGVTNSVVVYDDKIFTFPSYKTYDVINDTFSDPSTALEVVDVGDDTVTSEWGSGNYDKASVYKLKTAINVTGMDKLSISTQGLEPTEITIRIYDSLGVVLAPKDYSNTFYYTGKTYINSVPLPEGAKTAMLYFEYYRVNTSNLRRTGLQLIEKKNADLAKLGDGTAKIWINNTTYPTVGGVPLIDYATQNNNRIFAVEGNNIYASAQGDFADWTTFVDEDGNPDPTGAFATDVGSVGRFNGIATYKGRVVATKPDYVYEIYGDRPPYTVTEIVKTGCIDGRSICEVNSVLYWLGRKGIYSYTGGQPRIMSSKLNSTFTQGVAGTDGRKYYCSLYSDRWQLYVFDTFTGLWHIEDFLEVKDFTFFEGYLYAITANSILKLNSGNERVEWEFETKNYTFDTPSTKNVAKLSIRTEMQTQTELDVYLRSDNGEYSRVANYQADNMTMFDCKVRVKKCDSFSLKFVGRGDVRILDIHGKVTVGTSKHRSGDNLHVFRG